MKIGIIGAGNIGSALTVHFRRLEHAVCIANSRGPETLTEVARSTGAIPISISEVAKGVDLLVVAIPMKSVPALPKHLFSTLPATSPVIDTGNYYPLRDGRIPEIEGGMIESEWASHMLGRPVIKAFNNIVADSLLHRSLPKGEKNRIALPVSGNDASMRRARSVRWRYSNRSRGNKSKACSVAAWAAPGAKVRGLVFSTARTRSAAMRGMRWWTRMRAIGSVENIQVCFGTQKKVQDQFFWSPIRKVLLSR